MRCDVCHKTLKPEDAYEDSAGIELRIHKACISNATTLNLEPPDYVPSDLSGGVTMLQPEYARPARKANAPTLASAVPPLKCFLCNQPASESDKHNVKGKIYYAHSKCIQDAMSKLAQSGQQTGQESPMVQKARPESLSRAGKSELIAFLKRNVREIE